MTGFEAGTILSYRNSYNNKVTVRINQNQDVGFPSAQWRQHLQSLTAVGKLGVCQLTIEVTVATNGASRVEYLHVYGADANIPDMEADDTPAPSHSPIAAPRGVVLVFSGGRVPISFGPVLQYDGGQRTPEFITLLFQVSLDGTSGDPIGTLQSTMHRRTLRGSRMLESMVEFHYLGDGRSQVFASGGSPQDRVGVLNSFLTSGIAFVASGQATGRFGSGVKLTIIEEYIFGTILCFVALIHRSLTLTDVIDRQRCSRYNNTPGEA